MCRVLRRDDRTVLTDESFANSPQDFNLQAFAHIEDDDVVVVVLPTNRKWLPKISNLVRLSGTDEIRNLAKELLEVKKRIMRQRSVAIVAMQERQSDGRWQPPVEDLPDFLSKVPTVFPTSSANWLDNLDALVNGWQRSRNDSVKRGAGIAPLELELANALVGWNSGRIGTSIEVESADDGRDCDFRYDHSLYVALDAAVVRRLPIVPGKDEPLPEAIDPVDWILDESTTYGWLLGDAGSGKTITLSRAAAQAANRAIDWLQKKAVSPVSDASSRSQGDDEPRIPIVLSCPRFYRPPGKDSTPLDVSPQGLATRMAASREQQFDNLEGAWSRFLALLRSHKCLLLLDGVDAIDDEYTVNHINKSIQFLRRFASDVRIVVAAGSHHIASVPGDAAVVRIKPLDSPRRTALVDNFIALRPDKSSGKRVKQMVGSLLQQGAQTESTSPCSIRRSG